MDEQSTSAVAEEPQVEVQDNVQEPVASEAGESATPVEAEQTQNVPYDRFKEVNDQLKQYKEYVQGLNQQQQLQQFDPEVVDPQQIVNLATQQAVAQMEKRQQDTEAWNKAVSKHPEMAEDRDFALAVKGLRTSMLLEEGEVITYTQAADRLMKKVKGQKEAAKLEGIKEAQVSETIQQRQTLPTPTHNTGDDERTELQQLMRSADPKVAKSARLKYMSTYFGK